MKYCAIYRNGGTENFSWHRVMNPTTRDIAEADAAILRRGGRLAYVVQYERSIAVGLPETYAAGQECAE